ncbi:MAG TPA: dipicolinate synthase subunit B, partial [Firmicutes bacterium]|nr:dipicolinate synthase subunit B [Bacillota bacterium]
PVLMAAKAQLRNQRPVVLGVSTNDGLGINARNLGTLINAKNIYFIPFYQDNPVEKPNSITANFELLIPTILKALAGKQYQPILLG